MAASCSSAGALSATRRWRRREPRAMASVVVLKAVPVGVERLPAAAADPQGLSRLIRHRPGTGEDPGGLDRGIALQQPRLVAAEAEDDAAIVPARTPQIEIIVAADRRRQILIAREDRDCRRL